MKKVFLCFVCAGMIFATSAQEVQNAPMMPKDEVYAGLGLLNDNQLIAMTADIVSAVLTLGYLVEPGTYHAFTPFVGYRHWFTKRFGLGGIFAFDANSVKVYNKDDPNHKQEVNRYYMTFSIEPIFNYVAKPSWQLYGYLGLGGTVVNFSNAKFNDGSNVEITRVPYFNVHFTPIGARFGKDFGGFVEFGYGYKGIFNTGISYRF